MTDFQAGNNIIDVRDIIARVESLRADQENHTEEPNMGHFSDEEAEELETLESLLSDLCGNDGDEQWEGDWYPVTLIRESHFKQSMDEMLEDIGEMPRTGKIPAYMSIVIDYEMLKQDYQECEFGGFTYYYR